MVAINILGLLYISHASLPHLLAAAEGVMLLGQIEGAPIEEWEMSATWRGSRGDPYLNSSNEQLNERIADG